MGMRGHGGIIKTVTPGFMKVTYHVDEPGEYAVSVWHDLNDDTIFSMDDNYRPVDGWGNSGNPPTDRRPVFDDVKVPVLSFGTTVPVTLNYPN